MTDARFNKTLNVIILAAGKGTRMNNATPKVLHKICDKTLIEHVLLTSKKLSADKIISIISPDLPELETIIKNHNSAITYQIDRLGTGHAVKIALPELGNSDGKVVILYGDTPLVKRDTIYKMINVMDDKTAICVLGFKTKNPHGYGRLKINPDNTLEKIIEQNDASEEEKKIDICNSGVMVFDGRYIKNIVNNISDNNSKKEFYLTDSVEIAKKMGFKTQTILTDENEVMGINSQKERTVVEKIKQNELRNLHLKNGVIITDPETVYFSEETKIASGTTIEPNVIFKGTVNVKGACEIRAFSYLEDCEIEKDVIIGPYARIRPGSKIAAEAKIGNFVEIKNSNIGKDSKVSHLSYIGDSDIGNDVNIGAGTITCNYDGKNKFRTVIEDGAFIGSNSSLIAPVTIGKNAVLGAGTTLFKDAPAEKITINKKDLKNLDKK